MKKIQVTSLTATIHYQPFLSQLIRQTNSNPSKITPRQSQTTLDYPLLGPAIFRLPLLQKVTKLLLSPGVGVGLKLISVRLNLAEPELSKK